MGRFFACLERRGKFAKIACCVCTLLAGCSVVGPETIRNGRMAYNEAITETNNQQMLMVFVHNRFEETNHLLTVASVTANVTMSASAQVEAGFGGGENYAGNLVPFGGGFVYEENPTITYLPVAGEAYLNQLLAPVPLALFAPVSESLPEPEFIYDMLVSSVNGIRNPAFLHASQEDDPRFARFIELMGELTRRQCLNWVRPRPPKATGPLELAIEPLEECAPATGELLSLLGIARSTPAGKRLELEVTESFAEPGSDAIRITTRSVWKLVEILSARVDVPAAQADAAAAFPTPARLARKLHIACSDARPEDAYVAVEYRDTWYYIANRDLATKRYFRMLGSLWSAAMVKSLGENPPKPVLTVPVSR